MKKGIATVLSVLMVPYCLVPFCTVPTAADALDASPVVTVEYINIEHEIPKVTTIVTTIPTTTTEIATTTETTTPQIISVTKHEDYTIDKFGSIYDLNLKVDYKGE